ncbi:benzoate-CoA ligase family protein [Hwanghaeella sp.]|uniref:benzoate-CoA ligase family protein n=1 Tax=Hwanghaeella sp. TaxID=2605943 RepID=UPI003CCC0D4C
MNDMAAQDSIQIKDLVPRDGEAAREIGFTVPNRYNASAILFDNLDKGLAEKIAVYSDEGNRTYAALCEEACRYGNALLSLDLKRGDRVLIVLNDGPAYPAAAFGAIRAGLVPIFLNTQSPSDLLHFFAENSGARACITQMEFLDAFTAEDWSATRLQTVILTDGAGTETIPGVDIRGPETVAGASPTLEPADTGRDDMAFWMYSSGSTGRPKAVVHLHHDMLYTAISYADRVLGIQQDDICFSVPKIYFAYGFGNSVTFPFHAGASAMLFAGRPTPDKIFEQISRHRPTLFFALPTVYTAMIKAPEANGADLSSVRRCISAAEILSQDVFGAWEQRFGHRIVEGLGSTEVLHIYLSNSPELQKPGSAGKRVPGYEMKLTDRDGRLVGISEEGILWVRGDSNAPCYWNRPDKTAETMRDGWIWTGDRFVMDEDGFYFFKGRADDLIKVSGQWVYPLEVELCLNEHPKVMECAVMGLSMADGRMTLAAAVAPMPGIEGDDGLGKELKAYTQEKLLPYKYARQVIYMTSLPKTGTDKIDRQACKRALEETLRQ